MKLYLKISLLALLAAPFAFGSDLHPIQRAMHAAYGLLVSSERDLPAANKIPAGTLPEAVQSAFAERQAAENKRNPGLSLSAFKVEVDGRDTFAIWMPNKFDSIRAYLYVFDQEGNPIDQAAVYQEREVGTNGIAWQSED